MGIVVWLYWDVGKPSFKGRETIIKCFGVGGG